MFLLTDHTIKGSQKQHWLKLHTAVQAVSCCTAGQTVSPVFFNEHCFLHQPLDIRGSSLCNPRVCQQCCGGRPPGWVTLQAQGQEVPAQLADGARGWERHIILKHLQEGWPRKQAVCQAGQAVCTTAGCPAATNGCAPQYRTACAMQHRCVTWACADAAQVCALLGRIMT